MGLVHAPSLLFLDEPSTGLDPQNRANLWEHILQMRASAATPMTIMLTTHYLDEADSMAGRVVVVDNGEVIADDTAEALKADWPATGSWSASNRSRSAGRAELAAWSATCRWPRCHGRRRRGDRSGGRRSTALPELLRAAHQAGITVGTAQVHRPTLDDVFLDSHRAEPARGRVQHSEQAAPAGRKDAA